MKYNKPEVAVLGSAVDAIQSSTVKQIHRVQDQLFELATNSAYEADE
jgi:hypothetical protein